MQGHTDLEKSRLQHAESEADRRKKYKNNLSESKVNKTRCALDKNRSIPGSPWQIGRKWTKLRVRASHFFIRETIDVQPLGVQPHIALCSSYRPSSPPFWDLVRSVLLERDRQIAASSHRGYSWNGSFFILCHEFTAQGKRGFRLPCIV